VADQSETSPRIQVGDTVAYSQGFLDRQNRYPTNMPTAQGKVKALHHIESGMILADIEWNKRDLPKRVNIKNLTKTEDAAFGK
jgi:hypothetical protein